MGLGFAREGKRLMAGIFSVENLEAAWRRVRENQGCTGVSSKKCPAEEGTRARHCEFPIQRRLTRRWEKLTSF